MTDKEGNAQKEGQNFISWITLILGILALSLGFSLLFIPDKTHKMLNNFMAIFWQMTGIVMIRQETHLIRNRLLLILGISGLLIGFLGTRHIRWGDDSGWMLGGAQKLCWLALIIVAYGSANLVGGNEFSAAFVFGIFSGRFTSVRKMESIGEFAEIENALLMLTTYILFGMVMVLSALERLNLTVGFYVLFSLTIIRMAPVAVSLIGKRLRAVSVLFIGWFRPRGIASILYILTVVAAEDLFDREAIYTVAVISIFMCILAHGLTAAPLSNWYGKRIEEFNGKRVAVAEMKPVPEVLTRMEIVSPVAIARGGTGGQSQDV